MGLSKPCQSYSSVWANAAARTENSSSSWSIFSRRRISSAAISSPDLGAIPPTPLCILRLYEQTFGQSRKVGVNFAGPELPRAYGPQALPSLPLPRPSVRALGPVGGHKLLDPLQPPQQLVLRLGVGDADIPLPRLPERRSRQHRNASLRQQPVGQLPLPKPRALDIWKRIEGSLRPGAANTGDFVEAVHDEVPAMLEHLDHPIHRMRRLRRRKRLDRRDLRERGRARR